MAESLWELCLNRHITLKAEYIAGIMNVTADQALRMKLNKNNWKLHPRIFGLLNEIWGPFQLDLFANRVNAQLPRYISWQPDLLAEGMNALLQRWSKINLWTNPSWVIIP